MSDFLNLALSHPLINIGAIAGNPVGAGSGFALNGATDKVHFVFQMPYAMTITEVGFRYNSRTGTPVAHQVGLQAVSTSTGGGDGTFLSSANAKVAFTPPADSTWNSSFRWFTLDATYAATRGQYLAMVIEPTGTPDGSNYSTIARAMDNSVQPLIPYCMEVDGGVATYLDDIPIFAVRSTTQTFGIPIYDLHAAASGWNSGNSPNERGMVFTLPAAWGATYKMRGVRMLCGISGAGKTAAVRLYSGTTVLQDVTIRTEFQNGGGQTFAARGAVMFDETTLSTLNFGDTYRIAVTPLDASTTAYIGAWDMNATRNLEAWPLAGASYYTARNLGTPGSPDSTAWTDTNTVYTWMEPIIDDWTEPAGGSGGLGFSAGLNAGFNA